MKLRVIVSAASLTFLAACSSDPETDTTTDTETTPDSELAPDAEGETVPDAEGETVPDAEGETVPDAEPDIEPEAEVDLETDTSADTETTPAIDTDGDRLPDSAETNTGIYVSPTDTGTDPNKADSDGDAIADGDEVLGTLAGLDLLALGFMPNHRDLAVELSGQRSVAQTSQDNSTGTTTTPSAADPTATARRPA